MTNDVSVLAELALHIARLPPEQPLPLRLCSAGATLLGAEGGAVTLTATPGAPYVLATTDTVAERIESLQEVLGLGPRHEAHQTRRSASLDVGVAPDAPSSLAQEVREAVGEVRVHSYPMVVSGSVLGVFSVHLAAGVALSRDDDEAMVVAAIIGGALLRDVDEESSSMLSGWPARAKIHQATGMVIAQLKVSPDDALILIRAHAYAQGTTVAAVASALVERRLVFSLDDTSTGDDAR